MNMQWASRDIFAPINVYVEGTALTKMCCTTGNTLGIFNLQMNKKFICALSMHEEYPRTRRKRMLSTLSQYPPMKEQFLLPYPSQPIRSRVYHPGIMGYQVTNLIWLLLSIAQTEFIYGKYLSYLSLVRFTGILGSFGLAMGFVQNTSRLAKIPTMTRLFKLA